MSTTVGELANRLAACIRDMPAGHLRALAAALSRFEALTDAARAAALDAVAAPGYRERAAQVFELSRDLSGCTGQALALALETSLTVREHEKSAETIDVVATGPGTTHVSLRQTKAVVLDLIGRAQRELIAVSYAAYTVNDLTSALKQAHGRGVAVRLVLETVADSGGALTHEAADAFKAVRDLVETYVWPFAARPSGAKLHAKAVIADAEWAFVTSANLTGPALGQNLEVGLLVHGGDAPRRLAEHFRALIAGGTLRRG